MCIVKTPKIQQDQNANKPLPVMRNPLLDGVNPAIKSLRIGRNALRVDRGAPRPAQPGATAQPAIGTGVSAGLDIGGYR